MLFRLAFKSILSRKLSSILLILSLSLSVMLLIGVQKLKHSAKASFSHSISGTDLIIGARSGDIQLLLYSVFRQGQALANISWSSIENIRDFPELSWIVPISLGDSHRGYPVLGTSSEYFSQYRYGRKQSLSLSKGQVFTDTFELVLGAKVAKTLGYRLGQRLYLSHGTGTAGLKRHKDNAFTVVGILKPTGTAVDKTLHIPLEGFTALHQAKGSTELTPKSVTAAFIGLKSKFSIFTVQNRINSWPDEALMAIIPGVSLSRLWSSLSSFDTALFIISLLVSVIAFSSLLLVLFMSLQQRHRELAILRGLGAHPSQLFLLLVLEALFITVSSVILGLVLMLGIGTLIQPLLEVKLGLILSLSTLTQVEALLSLAIIAFGTIISIIPGFLAYRKGLSQGIVSI